MLQRLVPLALALLPLACLGLGASQDTASRRALDHEDYPRWRELTSPSLSRDGVWALYIARPADGGDPTLHVHASRGDTHHAVERAARADFDPTGRWVAATLTPPRDELKELRKDGKEDDELPTDALGLLDLTSGELERVERVKSFAVPEEDGARVAWLHLEPVEEDTDEDAEEAAEGSAEGEKEPAAAEPEPEEEPEEELTREERREKKRIEALRKEREDGTELVLRQLESGDETRFEKVSDYAFSKDGRRLALVTTDEAGEADGVHAVDAGTGEATLLLSGEGAFRSLAFDEAGERLAFLAATGDDYLADPQVWTLYLWRAGDTQAHPVARIGTAGVPDGWGVSPHRAPQFSESGGRLWFGTAPQPEPEPEEVDPDERVPLDVWAWTDDLIQPMQLDRLEQERERSYLAVCHLDEALRVVQLGDEQVPEVRRPRDGESTLVLGESDLPYRRQLSWDVQVPSDVYAIDVTTGERRRLLEARRGRFDLSPGGGYVAWWDLDRLDWRALDLRSGRESDLTSGLDVRFDDELHDTPDQPGAYGSGGWLAGDRGLVVYDRHDVWLLDPAGRGQPVCVTEGVGRRQDLRFRLVDLDREEEALDPEAPLLLAAFHYETRDAGFWRDAFSGAAEPRELVMSPHAYGTPAKADEAELLRWTRESFGEFGDLWVSGLDLADARRLSDVNPQQAEYRWGTAELVRWTSIDGEPLDGLLFKPEGFDASRQYPLLVYFYERNSDTLHSYRPPTPHRSIIMPPFYTSRGYLVFVPDIPYEVGHPGRSALHAVVPGVTALVDQGFVDRDAIGVQGHSWGGYQIAWLITQTDLFAAAISGAPVSNMISAYGGIRWGTGMSRQFQYEKTQSRLGGTLWEATPRFVENSPVFYLDQVETPVLILHNDQDGAVPWYQGIEMFMGLRRLGKPAWMLNYNGQDHVLAPYALKRDYAIRMQQFLDHHLLGAPPAVWMVEGIPALRKGRDLGLDLVEDREADGE
jgi:dipeptidyl aminopeptidase/acylaminoacyl peptidase